MSTTVTYNGLSFTVPAVGDASWGTNVSNYLIALATGSLTKAGGAFTLTGEVDFGGTYGLKSLYFKTKTVTPSLTGVVRLANGDSIGWRNALNTADLLLGVNASNQLTYGGVTIPTIALGAANQLLGMNAAGTANEYKTVAAGAFASVTVTQGVGTLTLDAAQDIRSSASPTFAGATLTGFSGVVKASAGALSASALVNADISGAAAIAYSKLALTGAIVNADISASAAIAYSKLALSASIATGDLAVGLLVPVTKGGTGVTTSTGSGSVVLSTSPTLTTPIQASYEDLTEIATPANPSASKLRFYAKSDDRIYTLSSGGVETAVGSSGTGELDLVASPSTATGWTNTGTTGAGANAPATTTTVGDLPLNSMVTTAIKITSGTSAGAEASNYTSYAFTTPAAYAVKTKVEFWMRPGTNFAANEWTLSVYAGSTRQALTTDVSSVTYLPNGLGKFTAYFDAVASTAYTVRFARTVNAGANAGVLNLANVIVGPGIQPQGAVVGLFTNSYTPTVSNLGSGSVTTSTAKWRQVGASIEVAGFLLKDGTAGTGPNPISISLPSGYTIDDSALPTTATSSRGNNTFGSGLFVRGSDGDGFLNGASVPGQLVIQGNADLVSVAFYVGDANAYVAGSDVGAASRISYRFTVPISQLSGSGTLNMAQNAVEYVYFTGTVDADSNSNGSQTGYGPTGATMAALTDTRNKYVLWQSPPQNGDLIFWQVSIDGGVSWSGSDFPWFNTGTSTTSVGIRLITTTAGVSRFVIGRYTDSTNAWSSAQSVRFIKVASNAALGFAAVSQYQSGLMPASNASLDDASATRLGLKQYLHGTTYNGGNAPTISATNLSTTRGVFIPYQMQDGTWRMRFNIGLRLSVGVASFSATLNGVVWNSNYPDYQTFSAIGGSGNSLTYGIAQTTNLLSVGTTTASTQWALSGDVELNTKPTWAY